MNRLTLASIALSVSCISATAGQYKPSFDLDYQDCGVPPVISGNSFTFGSGKPNSTIGAGRAVSQAKYRNINKVTATFDLSGLGSAARPGQNYVNAALYLISNPTFPDQQPKGNNYCDAGDPVHGHPEWNCREIDFVETNGNKIFQTTLHLGKGGNNAPQRYEYSFAATATDPNDPTNKGCFNSAAMQNDPAKGLHSLIKQVGQGKFPPIDMSKPFDVITDFTLGNKPGMKTTYAQSGGQPYVVYDTDDGPGAEGSGTINLQDLKDSMGIGYWILVSFWQGYSPAGPGSSRWFTDAANCRGVLCNTTQKPMPGAPSKVIISKIEVVADSENRPIKQIFVRPSR
jgi:hypothetical protein